MNNDPSTARTGPKVILMAAISLDGFITRHDQPGSGFTSPEDKAYFQKTVLDFDCLLFGAGNYRQSSRWIDGHLRTEQLKIVFTRTPDIYARHRQPDRLEFTSAKPADVVRDLAARGYRNAGLLGGGQLYGLFLAENLVDELWLTVEPLLFGRGIKLAENHDLHFRGDLLSCEKLGDSTLLLKYRPTA